MFLNNFCMKGLKTKRVKIAWVLFLFFCFFSSLSKQTETFATLLKHELDSLSHVCSNS